ncbi:MAG: hybrid sensor histidine kinase/response regulator [Legionella sp.]|nr:MAG: hybrid sensor histidine kinase/response regulator [Legionella sp.]
MDKNTSQENPKSTNIDFEITIKDLSSKIYDFETKYQRLKGLIDNLPGDIYWKDQNCVWIGLNKHCAQSLQKMGFIKNGIEEEVIGKTDFQLFNHTTAEVYRKNDLEVMKRKIEVTREETTYLSNGELIVLLSIKSPLLDKNGNIIGIAGNTIDITERKQIEADLRQAKTAAEAASIAKTEFIANMSHDIRTPLSGVVGLGMLAEQEIDNPSPRTKVHDMVKSADELLNMLNKFLDVVSLGNITFNDIHEEPFDLHHLVQTVIDLEQSSVDLKKINLRKSIDEHIPPILIGDHDKIHHIILNLVGNSIKFTQSGCVDIAIKLVETFEDKIQLLFEVSDTGIGIPSESLNKIFEVFYKVTPSYKGLNKGHGVGLHIVKTYTELLGGKISVESNMSKGSKFSFTLTLKIAEKNVKPQNISHTSLKEPVEKSPILQPLIAETTQHLPNVPEVLIIEDNTIALTIAQTLVTQTHCHSTPASDGESALELAKNKSYDLILSDVGLPGMSGIEFTLQLRAHEKKHHIKPVLIIGVTAHAEGKMHDECIASGMNHVIIKPLNIEKLTEIYHTFSVFNDTTNTSSSSSTAISKKALGIDLPNTEEELFAIDNLLIFDIENAKKVLGNDNSLLMDMLKLTMTILSEELSHLKPAHEASDWEKIAKVAHKLKGGFVSIGLTRAATACQYLERYHKAGHIQLLEKLYDQMIRVLDKTAEILKTLIK